MSETKQPPKLSLPKGLRWSLFLSHCWQYPGVQEAVATINRELQRLIPNVSIFLVRTHSPTFARISYTCTCTYSCI